MADIVVIGAGQAGVAVAARLRAGGHTGALTLIGEEPVPPYQRPPLSKGYLKGEMPLDRLLLRNEAFYAENAITLRLGRPVTAINRTDRTVTIGGAAIRYDHLVLTTGSVPRRLPAAMGGDLAGVHVVRSLADIDGMAPEYVAGRRVLIIGGGYIGLEAAAVAAEKGLRVTLTEAAPRILQRVAAPEVSGYFRALHRAHGVEIIEGLGLDRLTGARRVSGAVLADGREMAVDFVILGIGIAPATALAEAAGLVIDNGIAVDLRGRTSDPAIWAAGDCASFPWQGGRLRLENVQNAIDQAECLADNILGADRDYAPEPWFWSDQYDAKLQIAGLSAGYDRLVPRPAPAPAPAAGRAPPASFWYFRQGRLIAVDAINDGRAYLVGKRLLAAGKTPDPAVLADPAADLKSVLG
jgi:3-phenylpropionate/trans-cinnamate dioxygenase ferredoxin reductase subunit